MVLIQQAIYAGFCREPNVPFESVRDVREALLKDWPHGDSVQARPW